MSRVRYVNKKTGWVSIYESTSCYDPVAKTSRPKRKYIGYEDPITHEFIPSSGKRGRKKQTVKDEVSEVKTTTTASYKDRYALCLAELNKEREELKKEQEKNKQLTAQIAVLSSQIDLMINMANAFHRDFHSAVSKV